MELRRVILNLWYVVDQGGAVSSLRARAYIGTGSDADDLAVLHGGRHTDYPIGREFPVPERFCPGEGAAPASVLDELKDRQDLFEDAVEQIRAGIPEGGGPGLGEKPFACVTALSRDGLGRVMPADRAGDSSERTSLREEMRERLEWALQKLSFGPVSEALDDIYVMQGVLWGEVPDETGVGRNVDLSDELRQEINRALRSVWDAHTGGAEQDRRLSLGKLWRAYRQLTSGEELGNIIRATRAGDAEKVNRILDDYPEEVASEDDGSWTPLHWAVFDENAGMAELLLGRGASANTRAWEGVDELCAEAPLHIAARFGNLDLAGLLLRHGASLELTDDEGATPLGVAAAEGDVDMAAFLLDHGANPNAANNRGHSPLHIACVSGNIEMGELLLQHGADTAAPTGRGMTPLDLATEYGRPEMVRLFEDRERGR